MLQNLYDSCLSSAMTYLKPDDEALISAQDYASAATLALLVNARDEVLLILRDDIPNILFPNYWNIAGGKHEDGETFEEGARREAFEETGFLPSVLTPLCQTINHGGYGGKRELIVIYAGLVDRELSELTLGEGQEMGFYMLDQCRTMRIIPFEMDAIELYFQLKQQRAKH